jgi:hypothetical protein
MPVLAGTTAFSDYVERSRGHTDGGRLRLHEALWGQALIFLNAPVFARIESDDGAPFLDIPIPLAFTSLIPAAIFCWLGFKAKAAYEEHEAFRKLAWTHPLVFAAYHRGIPNGAWNDVQASCLGAYQDAFEKVLDSDRAFEETPLEEWSGQLETRLVATARKFAETQVAVSTLLELLLGYLRLPADNRHGDRATWVVNAQLWRIHDRLREALARQVAELVTKTDADHASR